MSKLSIFKKAAALSLVSLMAAASVPTAAAGVEDNPSDSITVGVVIDQEPNECTNASLTLPEDTQLVANPNFSETIISDNLFLFDLVDFAFRDSRNIEDDIEASFPIGTDFENEFWEPAGTADELTDPDNLEYIYSTDREDFPWDHPADLNEDGKISLPGDIPTYLLETRTFFETPPFDVAFDAGECVGGAVQYGLLSVARGNFQSYLPFDGIFDWEGSEVGPYINEIAGSYNGYGDAFLAIPFQGSSYPSDSLIGFGLQFALAPSWGYGFDKVSLATRSTQPLYVGIEIAGPRPDIVGAYRVQFDFDLFVGDAAEIWGHNPEIGCDLYLVLEDPCDP